MKKYAFLLICLVSIFLLSQCDKNEFLDDDSYSTIAFIARITDNSADWSLCIMDKSGNDMRTIVEMKTTCQKPVRSNSRTHLLFYHFPGELYSVNIDGTGLTLIDRAENGYLGSADWSPDDRQIVYTKHFYDSEKSDLILYNVSDKTYTILLNDGNPSCPKFSPNGKQIAYCKSTPTDRSIYKIDVSGNNNQLIINNASCPNWSPAGDKITYLSSGEGGSTQIFVVNVDGSNSKQLTSTISPRLWPGWPPDGNEDPQWTPDGKKIVYVSHENEKAEIFIMNSDGSKKTRLTKAKYRDGSPEVTPDGNYILFNSNMTGICMMKLDGSKQKVIFNGEGIYPTACK